MNEDTHLIGLVFLTEDPRIFRQAQAIAIEPGQDEPITINDNLVALVDIQECEDLMGEKALAGVMELVSKAQELNSGSSIYVIYGGTKDDLKNAHMPMVFGGI